MKKPKQSQPEGGVDIFKKKPKQNQPEGSGGAKKKKLIQRQPEGSGAPKKKKLVQRQPEGSGAPKKITGKGEFDDTNRSKKAKVALPKTKAKPQAIISALASKSRKKKDNSKITSTTKQKVNNKKTKASSIAVDSESFKAKPKRGRDPKVSVRQGTTDQKRGSKVQKASEKKLSFFQKIMQDTKRNFSGDRKKGTGRFSGSKKKRYNEMQ